MASKSSITNMDTNFLFIIMDQIYKELYCLENLNLIDFDNKRAIKIRELKSRNFKIKKELIQRFMEDPLPLRDLVKKVIKHNDSKLEVYKTVLCIRVIEDNDTSFIPVDEVINVMEKLELEDLWRIANIETDSVFKMAASMNVLKILEPKDDQLEELYSKLVEDEKRLRRKKYGKC